MTITNQPARNEYTSSAGQTIFNYTFKIFSNTDLNVYVTPAGQVANDASDLTTAYTVSGVGDEAGGSITLTSGASINDLVTIVSSVPTSRVVDYQNNGDFIPGTVNSDFDRVVSIAKKVEDLANRTLLTEQSQQLPQPLTMPQPEPRALLRWKADSSGIENVAAYEATDLIVTTSEVFTLTDGQTLLEPDFNVLDASVYINGFGADNGRLNLGLDYTVNTVANTITLTESYPAGTQATLVINEPQSSDPGDLTQDHVLNLATLADAVSDNTLQEGMSINLKERTTGNGGGAMWDVVLASSVTANTYNIVACTGVPTLALKLRLVHPRDPAHYGAIVNTDITDILNHINDVSSPYGEYEELTTNLRGRKYKILGTVYLRKGQDLFGDFAHVYMAGSGSIRMGEDSLGNKDPSGHPMSVQDMWIEGGAAPIYCEASGYSITNVFVSFPSVPVYLGGTDATVTNFTIDGGSTLLSCSASASVFTNCIFYVGEFQLVFTGIMRNTTFVNCAFDYGKQAAIVIADPAQEVRAFNNITFSNCVFMLNSQYSGQHKGFVYTNNSTISGDFTFSNCGFRNGYKSSLTFDGAASNLDMNFNNCIFDGEKQTSTAAQSTTMYVMQTSTVCRHKVKFNDCVYKNLHDTPFKLAQGNTFDFIMDGARFSDNTSPDQVCVDIATGQGSAANIELSDITSDGTPIFAPFTGSNFVASGKFKNWLPKKTSAGRDYVEIPFKGASMVDIKVSINRNPGGSTSYRRLAKLIATIGYDYVGGVNTQGTLTQSFVSTSPLGGTLDFQLDIDSLGAGIQVSGKRPTGLMIISWPQGYGNETIEAEYELVDG